jgi:hypothetical protein
VESSELIYGGILVAVLLGLAGYYGFRQVRLLRGLRQPDERSLEEREFTRRQAWRRLVSSALMVLLAGLLAGSAAFTPTVPHLTTSDAAATATGDEPRPDSDEQRYAKIAYNSYWIVFLLVLLAILVMAGLDVVAIQRYGRKQLLQIQTDRRAMIEKEVARLRRDRNGHV